jgi:hypothetical protein
MLAGLLLRDRDPQTALRVLSPVLAAVLIQLAIPS